MDEEAALSRAIALSAEHMAAGHGGPFGAVVVRGGQVLGEGWNQVTTTLDPTAHAEVVALRRACQAVGAFSLDGATLYSSCEPCPMCLAAAHWARVARIVYANTRDEAARIGFDDALLYEEVSKPPNARLVPAIHRPRPAALAVFEAWLAKPDRVAY